SDLAAALPFLEAIALYPQLSRFKSLLQSSPDLAPILTVSNSSASERITVLVPNNSAFNTYRASHGSDISQLPKSDLKAFINSHILVEDLPSARILAAELPQLVIPTQLTDERY